MGALGLSASLRIGWVVELGDLAGFCWRRVEIESLRELAWNVAFVYIDEKEGQKFAFEFGSPLSLISTPLVAQRWNSRARLVQYSTRNRNSASFSCCKAVIKAGLYIPTVFLLEKFWMDRPSC